MRRSTLLVVLLVAAVALITGATGFALARGVDPQRSPGAAFEMASRERLGAVTTRVPAAPSSGPSSGSGPSNGSGPWGTMVSATVATVPLVTVPPLPAAEPSPTTSSSAPPEGPPPSAAAPTSAAPAQEATPTAPAPTTQPVPQPAPAPPADAPLAPPYTAVLGWTGEGNVAYLTFDDGPGPYTGRILDILAGAGVKATFCQLGNRVTEDPGMAQRIVAEGHTLCNHSWDHHSPFDALPPETLDQQIGLTQNAIASATGVTARYFRAPEGRFGDPGGTVLQAAQRARTIPLGWAVDSLDWRKPGASAIVTNVMTGVSPGAVILLHDGGGTDREQTVEALPGIISGLQAAGYTLAALPTNPAG